MKNTKSQKLNISLIYLSALCGIFVGISVFFFKFCATYVIRFSKWAYGYVSERPLYIPLLIVGLTILSGIIYYILKTEPQVKGGGIPTSVKYIREGKSFNVLKNIFLVPISALITFLSGVPLGNEGPSVQLGCAMGEGVSEFCKKTNALNRKHVMTAGACAGFGVATGAPLSGILFSVEEIRDKFSIKTILSVGISTIFATATAKILSFVFGTDYSLFHIDNNVVLPFKYIWSAIIVGAITGVSVLLYYGLCTLYRILDEKGLCKINLFVKIEVILLVSGVLGIVSQLYIGTGHDIAHHLLVGENTGLLLLLSALILRMIMLTFANKTGITGGLFVPSLALGALIGAITAQLLITANVLPAEYSFVLVIMGMTAFLGIRGDMPLVALVFSVEALSGLHNIVPIILCTATAYCIVNFFKFININRKDDNHARKQ